MFKFWWGALFRFVFIGKMFSVFFSNFVFVACFLGIKCHVWKYNPMMSQRNFCGLGWSKRTVTTNIKSKKRQLISIDNFNVPRLLTSETSKTFLFLNWKTAPLTKVLSFETPFVTMNLKTEQVFELESMRKLKALFCPPHHQNCWK